jgi:hypothetical protein
MYSAQAQDDWLFQAVDEHRGKFTMTTTTLSILLHYYIVFNYIFFAFTKVFPKDTRKSQDRVTAWFYPPISQVAQYVQKSLRFPREKNTHKTCVRTTFLPDLVNL